MTHQQIVGTARALFARKGFKATTLQDIASSLDVTPAAILRRAGSKEKLFEEAMRATAPFALPDFVFDLERAGVDEPSRILRVFAEKFVPFARQRIEENIAVYVHLHSKVSTLALPWNPFRKNSPPIKAISLLEAYMRRAADAGTLRLSDPRAAALAFAGSLHSYVFFHAVFRIPPFPLTPYLDQMFAVWTDGAFVVTKPSRSRRKRIRRS